MIKSILIANRGEIVIRIARTAARMGITTYAFRTAKEPDALYLSAVDNVINFPETYRNIPEYLDIEAIIALAKKYNIEAIHPGYGYLSENADFAARCAEEDIIFIGPTAEVMRKMGDKITAKNIAYSCGMPMLPGSKGSVNGLDEAIETAESIGYPIIIKAAAGGGGRGMRIVRDRSEMPQMFKMATYEATNAFNDSSVFIEKYLENPKHIEFQIVADTFGNIVHLGERECSVQRRHQKLIEEAPSPALYREIRGKMAAAAVALAKSVKYHSLGTVEFLLDKKGNFYFMEMNTRIQVEHPITEMITGLDLVELQIKIASGKQLPITQEEVNLEGWAIECRINAEDVQADFAPVLGFIKSLRLPQGNNIRIDTGITVGSEITPWFDSMLAKLIVHGRTRSEAIELAISALSRFNVKGIKTTIPFCKAVLHNEAYCSGNFDTSFIETQMKSPVYQEEYEEMLAALLAVYTHTHDNMPITGTEAGIDPWVLNKRIRNL